MDPPPVVCAALLSSLLACSGSGVEPPTLETAVAHVLQVLPWEQSTSFGPALCPTLGPCDTIWLEPRVARLPAPAPAFYVPDARPAIKVLENPIATTLPAIGRLHRPVRYGSWSDCLAARHDSDWMARRRVCVALGLAGESSGDTLHLALLLLTPAEGLKWPRVRAVHREGKWHAELLSLSGE